MRRFSSLALVLVLAACGGSADTSDRSTPASDRAGSSAPPTSTTTAPPVLPRCVSDAADLVTLTVLDGAARAYVSGTGTAAVVLSHQSDGDLCQLADTAKRLQALGYRTVSVDNPDNDPAVPRAGADYARAHGAKKIVYLGTSIGGTMSLFAAGTDSAQAVAALSAPASWFGKDAKAAIATVKAPVFLAAGSADADYAPDTRDLAAAARRSSHVETTVVAGSSAHGVALLAPGAVLTRLEAFLAKYAPPR